MSFLRWFGKKESASESAPSSDLAQADATLPMAQNLPAHATPSGPKSGRHERRELLYGVIRECMTGAGMLSSTYKFKVLSLDSSGQKYVIMMDIPREYFANPTHFADIEGAIARGAKERFDLLVTAVYWRVNEMVSAQPSRRAPPPAPAPAPTPAVAPAVAPQKPVSAPPPAAAAPGLEDLEDEVRAFKRAVASGAAPAAPSAKKTPSKRETPPPADFSDTVPFDNPSPLGPTQFGGLE